MIDRRAIDPLCLAMGLTLAVHTVHMPVWIWLPLAGLLVLRWWQLRHGSTSVSLWIKLPLVGLLLAAILVAYGNPFGRAPGSTLAVGLLVLKLLEIRRPRDVRSSVAFGCFVLMSALLFNQDMSFTVLVMLGLVPCLAALRGLQAHNRASGSLWEMKPVARHMLLALPLALFAFLFVPRLASPLWGAPSPDSGHTGLSSHMTPGNLTELLIDDSPALRVTFDGLPPPASQRYFRAWTMTRFDGREWSHPHHRLGPVSALRPLETISYTVEMEPTLGHVMPALDVAIDAPRDARMLANHELLAEHAINEARGYRLSSAVLYRLQTELDRRTRERNLALPADVDPKARALAARWRERLGGDGARIARAALDLFHDGGFTYTLAPAPLGQDSMDDFLFATREGFCEHYASAFTFLMRAAGIPARVVTGYQGGYWSEFGQYLLVRNSDAHAWSEIWLPDRGWVRYDPTAAVRPERVSLGASAAAGSSAPWYRSGWVQDLRNHWDIVNRWWGQAVVAFNQQRQQGLLTPFGLDNSDWSQLILVLAAGSSVLLGIAALGVLWRRERTDRLLDAQRRLERRLARLGVQRRRGEGPRDYMRRAAVALPEIAGQLQQLSARYLYLRYARQGADARAIAAYRRLVQETIKALVVK